MLIKDDLLQNTAIYLNGPPSVGKDTIGLLFDQNHGSTLSAFKNSLIEITLAIYNISHDNFIKLYESKELPCPEFNGLSPREALIFVSEEVIKPKFGNAFFGSRTALSIPPKNIERYGVTLTDCGFAPEINQVVKIHPQAIHILVRLHRNGLTYKNDSRSYIPDEDFKGDYALDVYLPDGPSKAALKVLRAIQKLPIGIAS